MGVLWDDRGSAITTARVAAGSSAKPAVAETLREAREATVTWIASKQG